MKTTTLPLPVIGLIAATRGMLGAGIALLVAGRMTPEQRAKVGRILFGIGAATTIPLMATVIRNRRAAVRHVSVWRSALGEAE